MAYLHTREAEGRMTDCTCPECCEFRAARDEDLACAQMFDYAIELRDRSRKDWEHSALRLRAAIVARNVTHRVGAA